jgi:hypothetical protein
VLRRGASKASPRPTRTCSAGSASDVGIGLNHIRHPD